jgi:hypothetical protein
MNGKKLERPLFLEMPFGEALARYAQTKPEEVDPRPGHRKKRPKTPSSGADGEQKRSQGVSKS